MGSPHCEQFQFRGKRAALGAAVRARSGTNHRHQRHALPHARDAALCRRHRVATPTSTLVSSSITPIAPSTRTSAHRRAAPGPARAPRAGPARCGHPRPATRRRRAAPATRSATAQASGLAMNVGPCISPAPSPAETARRHRGRAERRGERHVPARQRLADAHDVGRARRRAHRRTSRRCARSPWRSRRAQQQPVLVAELAQQARRTSGEWKRIPPAPARPARRSPRPARRRARPRAADIAPPSRRPAARRSRREDARRTRARASSAGEHAVHAADRVTDRHRADRVAVVAAADGQQPRAPGPAPARAGTAGQLDRHLDRTPTPSRRRTPAPGPAARAR